MNQPKIELKNVSKTYHGDSVTDALKGVTLLVPPKQITCIVGPSGCGKTTLIHIVAALVPPSSGRVLIDGQESSGASGVSGVVFQADSVFPWMTVEQNVAFGSKFGTSLGPDRLAEVAKYIELVGLTGFENMWPKELSGGMKKRVDIARAYAFNPDILLLDEPFGSLDVQTREDMQLLLLQIWRQEKKTIVLVTHDVEEAVFLGHHVAVMTPRPGSIKAVIEIPLPPDRDRTTKLSTDFIELRKKVLNCLSSCAWWRPVDLEHCHQ